MIKNIAILGSTGSIGKQTLEVISRHPETFRPVILSANNNIDLLVRQALAFRPKAVLIGSERSYQQLKYALKDSGIDVFTGFEGLADIITSCSVDMALVAMVGFAALSPVLQIIGAGINIALANKECLVVAGDMVTETARLNGVKIIPVDSEHSAVFQCLAGENHESVEKIFLTASGGPFLGKTIEDLQAIKSSQALKHPNWVMGKKITIDSATMMNKGLEVIEARWLFNFEPEQIDVIVHPQSIIHSIVQFKDGSMKAQMGLPDMRIPIQYALTYPERLESDFQRFDFQKYSCLTFQRPDYETFRSLDLAYKVMKLGGNMPCVLNAANEVAVEAFLEDRIGFIQIPEVIEQCIDTIGFIKEPSLNDYLLTNLETKEYAFEVVNHLKTLC